MDKTALIEGNFTIFDDFFLLKTNCMSRRRSQYFVQLLLKLFSLAKERILVRISFKSMSFDSYFAIEIPNILVFVHIFLKK